MNVNQILHRVKRQFGDESGVQVTDSDIISWVNEGQRQIVLMNEGLLESTAKANSVADQPEYDLPEDILILKSVSFKASGEASYSHLKGMSFADFNSYINGWDGEEYSSGTPKTYTVFAGKLILFPTPDTSLEDSIKVFYNRSPVDVVNGVDTPDLPELYHEPLIKHCLQQAYEMDEDWDAAQLKSQDRDTDISLLRGRDDWKQQETYPVLSILPEDAW